MVSFVWLIARWSIVVGAQCIFFFEMCESKLRKSMVDARKARKK
jgi:hypothetical protein